MWMDEALRRYRSRMKASPVRRTAVNVTRKACSMKRPQRQLVLNKGAEKYIFRYEQGREDELLDALIDQVKDKRTDFDWFDAAVLSFKLTQSLIGCAEQLLQDDSDVRAAS
jgi:hypothetical protein